MNESKLPKKRNAGKVIKKRQFISRVLAGKEYLTERLWAFCNYMAVSNNWSESVRKAGYTHNNFAQTTLKKKKVVIDAINELRKDFIDEYIASYLFCVMEYKDILIKAKEEGDYNLAMLIIEKIAKLKEPTVTMLDSAEQGGKQIKIIIRDTNDNLD